MVDAIASFSAGVSEVAPIVWRDSVAPLCGEALSSSYSDTLGDWGVVMPQAQNVSSTFRDVSVVAVSSTAAIEAGAASALTVGAVVLIGLVPGIVIWKSGMSQKFADWLVPMKLPPPENTLRKIVFPSENRPTPLQLPTNQTGTALLPPPQGSDTWRGDLPKDPRERMEVISGALTEDHLAQQLYLWSLRQGFIFGEDMKAILVASLLKTGSLRTRDLLNYLVLRFDLGFFSAFRAGLNLIDLAKADVVHMEKEKGDIRLSLKNPREAERWLAEYKKDAPQQARILGLVPAPQMEPVPALQEDPLKLIERSVRVWERVTEVAEHPQNDEAKRRAERLLKKLVKRQKLSEEKLAEFERQAEEIRASNRPRPVFAQPEPVQLVVVAPVAVPTLRIPHKNKLDVEETLAELALMTQQLRGRADFSHGDELTEIEGRLAGWKARPESVTPGDVWRAHTQLRRWSRELSEIASRLNRSNGKPRLVENGDNGIKFDGFPKSLEFAEASRILTNNGFEMREKSGGSHCVFTHSVYPDVKVTIVDHNSKQNSPKERVGHVKGALRKLAQHGVEITW